MSRSTLGYNFTKWLICKRRGIWAVIPPHVSITTPYAEFPTGAEALAAFASGGRA